MSEPLSKDAARKEMQRSVGGGTKEMRHSVGALCQIMVARPGLQLARLDAGLASEPKNKARIVMAVRINAADSSPMELEFPCGDGGFVARRAGRVFFDKLFVGKVYQGLPEKFSASRNEKRDKGEPLTRQEKAIITREFAKTIDLVGKDINRYHDDSDVVGEIVAQAVTDDDFYVAFKLYKDENPHGGKCKQTFDSVDAGAIKGLSMSSVEAFDGSTTLGFAGINVALCHEGLREGTEIFGPEDPRYSKFVKDLEHHKPTKANGGWMQVDASVNNKSSVRTDAALPMTLEDTGAKNTKKMADSKAASASESAAAAAAATPLITPPAPEAKGRQRTDAAGTAMDEDVAAIHLNKHKMPDTTGLRGPGVPQNQPPGGETFTEAQRRMMTEEIARQVAAISAGQPKPSGTPLIPPPPPQQTPAQTREAMFEELMRERLNSMGANKLIDPHRREPGTMSAEEILMGLLPNGGGGRRAATQQQQQQQQTPLALPPGLTVPVAQPEERAPVPSPAPVQKASMATAVMTEEEYAKQIRQLAGLPERHRDLAIKQLDAEYDRQRKEAEERDPNLKHNAAVERIAALEQTIDQLMKTIQQKGAPGGAVPPNPNLNPAQRKAFGGQYQKSKTVEQILKERERLVNDLAPEAAAAAAAKNSAAATRPSAAASSSAEAAVAAAAGNGATAMEASLAAMNAGPDGAFYNIPTNNRAQGLYNKFECSKVLASAVNRQLDKMSRSAF